MSLRPPIFIIGSPRSGTTLFRLMLTSHPEIVVPPECGFAVWWRRKYNDWKEADAHGGRLPVFLDDLASSKKIETWKLDYVALATRIREREPRDYPALVSLIYESFGNAMNSAMQRWGDKNNFHIRHIADLHAMFPNAVFLHIIRDGRDVACSYRELSSVRTISAYAPRLPAQMAEIAREWAGNIAAIRESFAALGWRNVCEVRYEDLLANTEPELRRICDAIGELFDRSMLDYSEKNRREQLEPADFLAWKKRTLEPPDTSRAGRYLRDLTAADIAEFETAARPTLAAYRYV